MVSALGYCMLASAVSIGITLGELRTQLHLSGTLTALHGSSFGIGMVLAGLFGNQVVRRFGRPRVFWVACASVMVGVVLFCVGSVVSVTLLGATIGGLAAATIAMVQPGLIADHHDEHRSAAFAAVNAYPALCGVVLALGVGATLSAHRSWRWTFVTFVAALFVALIFIGRRATVPAASVTSGQPVWRLFRSSEVRWAWLDMTLAVFVEFPIGIWSTVYMKEVAHATPATAPVLACVFGLALFASRLLLPRIATFVGPTLREWSLGAAGFSALTLWAVPSLPAKFISLAAIGFCAGPLYPASIDRLYAAAHGFDSNEIGSLAALASGTGVTIAPLGLGLLADVIGLRTAVLVVPTLAIIALAVRLQPARRTIPSAA